MKKKERARRTFRHLNQFDRDRIEALLRAGHDQKDIALVLQKSESCISRERKRKRKNGFYEAKTAQKKAQAKRLGSKYQGMKIENHPKLKQRIIKELKDKRSPDEIAGRMKKEGLKVRASTKAIYRWLYSASGQNYCKYLCTRRYSKKKRVEKPKRVMIPNRVSIKERPLEGEHAEGDLFVSPTKSKSKRSGVLMVVPSSQLMIGRIIANKKPSLMKEKVNELVAEIKVDDLTFDNGIENRNHEEFSLPAFFCDPYSPWQKPHVENNIGLLRRWFIPKKTNLDSLPEEDYQAYLNIFNHKYRKSLGYKTAYEVSLENGIIKKIPEKISEKCIKKLMKK